MRRRPIFLQVLGAIVAVVLVAAAVIFIQRYAILQYSIDTAIRHNLPGYIEIDKIVLEPQGSRLVLKGFKILNPPGFSRPYLIEVEELIARYRMRGKNVLDGIEVLEPVFQRPVLTIERDRGGTLNIMKMPGYIREMTERRAAAAGKGAPSQPAPAKGPSSGKADGLKAIIGDRTLADMVTLPETFRIKNGRLVFVDARGFQTPCVNSLDAIEAQLSLKLDRRYTAVLRAGSVGEGLLNGKRGEVVRWDSSYDPTTPRLTMSNRFDVSNLDVMALKPYYDRFSPFDFQRGIFSGTLVFDFDNGNIGSTNEIHLGKLAFSVKPAADQSAFWDASTTDIAKYFTTPSGEVVFDFKIKGDMSSPKFYLGPISKRAVTAMTVDKVSQVLQQVAAQAQGAAQQAAGGTQPAGDGSKAADYIGLITDLMKKNN